jgi:hypothetical protein
MQAGPKPTIQGARTVCKNSTMTYQGPGEAGSLYYWQVTGGTLLTRPDAPSATIQWGPSGTGTVDLRQTVIATGCIGDAPTFIVQLGDSLEPTVRPIGASALCEGGSVTLDAGPGYRSYLWSTGETTQTINVSTAGGYVVSVKDSLGCSGSSQPFPVTVRSAPRPAISPMAITICQGDSVQLDAPPGYATYLWSTGAITSSIFVKDAGDYSVVVTDTNGCRGASPAARVKVHPVPARPTISSTDTSLVSSPATAYQWSRDGVPLADGTERAIPLQGEGEYQVRITDEFGCSSISVPYNPYSLMGTTVTVPFLQAAAGEHVLFPIVLDAPQAIAEAGDSRFTARIRFNKTLLKPVGSTPIGVVDGHDRVITITGVRPGSLTTGSLVQLEFIAMLGDTARTPITIEEFLWNDVNARAKTVDGTFTLTDLCLAGGTRLLRASGEFALKPSRPNPATGVTEIEYETVEKGRTRLIITDPSGRRVATLVDGDVDPGRYLVTFDASAFASGFYVYTLETPTQRLSRTMVVAH